MKYLVSIAVAGLLAAAATVAAAQPHSWSAPQKIDEADGNSSEINTSDQDGCPILSPDGKSLYLASNRKPGGHGGLDIWVARRTSPSKPFGDPESLPAPINSTADDFCPTPLPGGRLLFVSRRTTTESCGMGDIYMTREHPKRGWEEPVHLACAPDGPNSALDEQGPSLIKGAGSGDDEDERGSTLLFFSRSSPAVKGDIYLSRDFGPAEPVTELNSPGNDIQPNVRRNGREIVFSSDHAYPGAEGGQDIYVATRESMNDPWSDVTNIAAVNTWVHETRPSLSRNARTLLFGRAPGPEGSADIFFSTR